MSALYYRSLAALRTKGMYIRNVSSSSMTKNSQATIKLPFEKQVYEFRGLADALNHHRKNEQYVLKASTFVSVFGVVPTPQISFSSFRCSLYKLVTNCFSLLIQISKRPNQNRIKTLASAMKIALGGITIYWSYTKLTHPLDDEP
mmetsp:Transcript_6764/g.12179  ORF Transcript_6764/g.12179 Transcript_6764/m.12179 type:complete len:145 (+) Transcript_6764:245-679(+)